GRAAGPQRWMREATSLSAFGSAKRPLQPSSPSCGRKKNARGRSPDRSPHSARPVSDRKEIREWQRRAPWCPPARRAIRFAGARFSDFRAELQVAGPLAHNDETGIGALRQNEARCVDQDELAFIWPNHTDACDERRVCRETHFPPEFHPVARRIKFLQINGRADDLNLGGIDSVLLDELTLNDGCVSDDFRAAMLEHESAPFVSDRVADATCAGHWNSAKIQGKGKPVVFRAVGFD